MTIQEHCRKYHLLKLQVYWNSNLKEAFKFNRIMELSASSPYWCNIEYPFSIQKRKFVPFEKMLPISFLLYEGFPISVTLGRFLKTFEGSCVRFWLLRSNFFIGMFSNAFQVKDFNFFAITIHKITSVSIVVSVLGENLSSWSEGKDLKAPVLITLKLFPTKEFIKC